jgi:hypothetical protein
VAGVRNHRTADSIRSHGRPRRAGGTCRRGRLGSIPVLDR